MIKKKILILTAALISFNTACTSIYAEDNSVSCNTYISVGDLIQSNDFDNYVAFPWTTVAQKPAEADFNVEDGKYNTIIKVGSEDRWGVQTCYKGLTLERGHTYNVQFELTATEDCRVYAEIGDMGDPYNEYWNNNWNPFTVKKGETVKVNQTFVPTSTIENCEMAFHFTGDCQSASLPYTVSLDNVHIYDEQFGGYIVDTKTPSKVRINQLGYSSQGSKTAVADIDSLESVKWELFDSNGDVVKSGNTILKGYDNISGTTAHVIDFSDYETTGEGYYIGIPEYDYYSASFQIGDMTSKYADLRYDALKYFYLNRTGVNLNNDYSKADVLPIKPNTWYSSNSDYTTVDVNGGWDDSESKSKNTLEGSFALWMLQNKYEYGKYNKINGKDYTEESLNIPESTDAYPDILNEGLTELEYLSKMQIPQGKPYAGMVYHNIEKIDTSLGIRPCEDSNDRQIMPPSTAATLDFAAVAAQASRVWKDYDSEGSIKFLNAAENAWKAAIANPNIKVNVNGKLNESNYGDSELKDEFYFAACELYAATGKEEYLNYIKSSEYYLTIPKTITDSNESSVCGNFNVTSVAGLGTLSLLSSSYYKPDNEELNAIKENILEAANFLITVQNENAYGIPTVRIHDDFSFNSNLYMTNAGIVLAYAKDIAVSNGDNDLVNKYGEGINKILDYLLGKNPNDKSYVTGYGTNFVEHPYTSSMLSEDGTIPSGIIVNGADSYVEDEIIRSYGFRADSGMAKALYYKDNDESYSTNKTGLSNNASFAWLLSYVSETSGAASHYYGNGDVNDDYVIDLRDFVLLQEYLYDPHNPSAAINKYNADINGDNRINVVDLLLLKKKILN